MRRTNRTTCFLLSTFLLGLVIGGFLAFALERELEYRLNARKIEHSPEQIKSALRSMQCSELNIEDEPHYLRGKHPPLASQIFGVLNVKQPINIMNKQQWGDYLKEV